MPRCPAGCGQEVARLWQHKRFADKWPGGICVTCYEIEKQSWAHLAENGEVSGVVSESELAKLQESGILGKVPLTEPVKPKQVRGRPAERRKVADCRFCGKSRSRPGKCEHCGKDGRTWSPKASGEVAEFSGAKPEKASNEALRPRQPVQQERKERKASRDAEMDVLEGMRAECQVEFDKAEFEYARLKVKLDVFDEILMRLRAG